MVTVDVSGDTDVEGDEEFTVTLSDASVGAQIIGATAVGTIRDDDAPPPPPPAQTVLIDADFALGPDGFAYVDGPFVGGSPQAYADGAWVSGVLRTTLGGIDGADITDMSGGWQETFSLASASEVTLSFRYNMTQALGYESDEFSEVRYLLDGGPSILVAQLTGDGNGGSNLTTGWQTFAVSLGTLSAGVHTLTLGGLNNKKTIADEETEILIDDVLVTSGAAPPPVAELSISPVSADKFEGDLGTTAFTFEVTRSGNTEGSTSVVYTVTPSGVDPTDTPHQSPRPPPDRRLCP